MRLKKFFPGAAAFALMLAIGLPSVPAHADLNGQMNAMFNAMSNTTNPAVVMGQRRGVITGGRYSLRTRVMDVQILSILPPSINAGCGGIDLFGGSFSFISMDRFVQLLRTIAANAAGYAFKMAIQAMCPSCADVMAKLQSIIQKLNGLTVNSCHAAKSLVNSVFNGMTKDTARTAANATANKVAGEQGVLSDFLTRWFPSMNENESSMHEVSETNLDALEDAGASGNIVWSALKEADVAGWYSSGDLSLLEAILSVTGSVIVRPPADAEGETSVTPVPPILKVDDFIKGTNGVSVQVYECISAECYDPDNIGGPLNDPAVTSIPITSFRERVGEKLMELVNKLAMNTPLSASDKSFMGSLPSSIGGMIRNLTRQESGSARAFAHNFAPVIANVMATQLIQSMIKTARVAVAEFNSPLSGQLLAQFSNVEQQLMDQSLNIKTVNMSLTQMVDTYNNRMIAAKKDRRGLAEVMDSGAQ